MKKIIEKLKDKDLDVLLTVLVLVIGASIFASVDCNDELWNFANCYKMFNGYKIYGELNVIITPLFFYIAQIFFKIFGPTYLSFRIYNIVISTILVMLIYLMFKSLKIVRRRAIFYTTIMAFILGSMVGAGANYNMLVVIPILIAIILILKQRENPTILGILLFLTFMIKQNVYIFFAIGIFFYEIIDKKDIKILISELLRIYLISFIGIFIFLLYMYFDNNLYNFINYCFLGISEFGAKNINIEFSGARYLCISIIAIIFSIVIMYNKKMNCYIDKLFVNNIKILLSFGIPMLLISYPIINYYHCTLASIIMIIELIYIIENVLIKDILEENKKEKIIYVALIVIYIVYLYFVRGIILTKNNMDKGEIIFNNTGVFKGTLMTKEDCEDIKIICNYIKTKEKEGIDVKVLSYKANSYMVQLNKNNGIFDMAFVGNLGLDGEKGLIDKVKELDNTLVLISSNPGEFYQESKEVRNYIINNYEKIGEVQEYFIYDLR